MIDYDSFSRCYLTDIFFRFSRGSKRVNGYTNGALFSLFWSLTVFPAITPGVALLHFGTLKVPSLPIMLLLF